MIHDFDWEAAAHIGRYKRNLMGSSRTIEIEIPRVQLGIESYKNYDGFDMDAVNFKSEGVSNKIQRG